jgi:hypothetical protein
MNRILLALIVVVVLLVSGCKKDDNPIVADPGPFKYPDSIGNQWDYERTFSTVIIRPDSTGQSHPVDTSVTSPVIMKVIRKDTLRNSIEAYLFQEIITENNRNIVGDTWYVNSDSGLSIYAYHGAGLLIPKSGSGKRFFFNGRYFSSVREITSYVTQEIPKKFTPSDSITYEVPPVLTLKYPLMNNSEWTYRSSGNPWKINKKIVGTKQIEVPAGKFNCFKIVWFFDVNNDLQWDENLELTDYVCEKGLIRRTVVYKDITIVDQENPTGYSTFDMKDESVLTHLNF